MKISEVYKPQHHIRIVTAASLFDGHDAAINIMRRILQASGAEVIHLGQPPELTGYDQDELPRLHWPEESCA